MYTQSFDQSFDGHYKALQSEIRHELLDLSSDELNDPDVEGLVEKLYSRHAIQPVGIDPSISIEKKLRTSNEVVPSNRRGEIYSGEGDVEYEHEYLKVMIPVTGVNALRQHRHLRTTQHSLSWNPDDFDIEGSYVTGEFCIKGYNHHPAEEAIVKQYETQKGRIFDWLRWLSADIEKGNATLKNWIRSAVVAQKNERADRESRTGSLMSKLG